ncbi:ER membrane protein complex subunit 7-like [Patiria miniata]|uniref:ER membrane protein complex subunit 7 beta-sandwich domain-containing protein n=1 Tax=Patiria miniata TaxID=46514 RepID=A0A913ZZR4_PATMI|nr:ER membrane protein complex subunit 7-like [Patiria miniata]
MLRTFLFVLVLWVSPCLMEEAEDSKVNDTFVIEGKVLVTGVKASEWIPHTRVLVDGGQYVGFLRADGAFKVTGVPSGSYVVEVANPTYIFEPARVDITAKGKMRARRVNHIQGNAVVTVPYPLRFKSKQHFSYFQKREEFRVTDMLKNPMVLMMVLPLIFIVVLPKLINTQDPEVQKEMRNMNLMNPKTEMPDLSEMAARMFGGGSAPPKKKEKPAKLKKLK